MVFARGLVILALGALGIIDSTLTGPSLPLIATAFVTIAGGSAAVSPPATSLAL